MSNNLGRVPIAEFQIDSQHVSSNDNDSILDSAITDLYHLDVATTSIALDAVIFQNYQTFRFADDTPPPSGPITLTVPDTWDDESTPANTFTLRRGTFTVVNQSSYPITVQTAVQTFTAPVVPPNGTSILSMDGTDVRGTSSVYDFGLWMPTTPSADDILLSITMVREVWFPADFAGSKGSIEINATSTFDIKVYKGVGQVGTISVSTGGVFTFSTVGNVSVSFNAGDRLKFIAPTTPDASAAGLDAVLLGYAQVW